MRKQDNQCSTRSEDWGRFGKALLSYKAEARHSNPVFGWILGILHTGKNIVVEEWRRLTGYCSGRK